MQTDFYDKVQELRNTGNPFATATVIRAEKPTSAKVPFAVIDVGQAGCISGFSHLQDADKSHESRRGGVTYRK